MTRVAPSRSRGNWILAAVVFAVCITLAEIGLRLTSDPIGFTRGASGDIPGLWMPDDTLGYRYRPGFSGEHVDKDFRVPVVIDSAGFRARSHAPPAHPNVSILVAGNSLAFGWGVRTEDTWAAVLESSLRGGRRAVVYNAGVSGYNVEQMATRAEREATRHRFNLTILEVYVGGIGRLDQPFALIGERFVMQVDVRRTQLYRGGVIVATNFESASAIALDHWLGEHFRIGQLFLHLTGTIRGAMRHQPPEPVSSSLPDPLPPALGQRILSRLSDLQSHLGRRGSKLLVLIAVTQEPSGQVSAWQHTAALQLARELAAANIDFITTLPLIDSASASGTRLRFEHDGHWNAAAHEAIGKGLACHVDSSKCPLLGN